MKKKTIEKKPKEKMINVDLEDIPVKVLASSIRDIAEGMRKLLNGPLKEETIVLLIHEHTKAPRPIIRMVLNSIPQLSKKYLKEKT